MNTLGGTQEMSIISESGLYSLILKFRKPEAKAFKKWVTRDVLPAIRKDGAYVMGEEKVKTGEMSEDELMARALIVIPKYEHSCVLHLSRSLACGTGRSPQQDMKLTFKKIIPGHGIRSLAAAREDQRPSAGQSECIKRSCVASMRMAFGRL